MPRSNCSRELRAAGERAAPTIKRRAETRLEQRQRFAFAMFHLVHRALTWRFVGAVTEDFCSVPESSASKMIVSHFDDDFWIDRLPFATSFGAPTARSPGSVAGES